MQVAAESEFDQPRANLGWTEQSADPDHRRSVDTLACEYRKQMGRQTGGYERI